MLAVGLQLFAVIVGSSVHKTRIDGKEELDGMGWDVMGQSLFLWIGTVNERMISQWKRSRPLRIANEYSDLKSRKDTRTAFDLLAMLI